MSFLQMNRLTKFKRAVILLLTIQTVAWSRSLLAADYQTLGVLAVDSGLTGTNLPPSDYHQIGVIRVYSSPQDAVNALVTAAQNHDTNALHEIFGPEGRVLVSPDAVQAARGYARFVERLTQKTVLVTNSDSSISLQ